MDNINMNSMVYSSRKAKTFAKYFANICGGIFKSVKSLKNRDNASKFVFMVGLYCPEEPVWYKINFKKAIIIFSGGDINSLLAMDVDARNRLFKSLSKKGAIFAVEAPHVYDDIEKWFGLKTEIIYLPSQFDFPNGISPLPKEFNVGCYIPKNRFEFFHRSIIFEVAKKMKDVIFHFYSLNGAWLLEDEQPQVTNIICYKEPILDMIPFLNKISCGLRITESDTYSMSGIEYNLAGRYFINNHYMPCCEILSKKPSVQEVIEKINIVREKTEPNIEGKKYYSERHSVNVFKKTITEIFNKYT